MSILTCTGVASLLRLVREVGGTIHNKNFTMLLLAPLSEGGRTLRNKKKKKKAEKEDIMEQKGPLPYIRNHRSTRGLSCLPKT